MEKVEFIIKATAAARKVERFVAQIRGPRSSLDN